MCLLTTAWYLKRWFGVEENRYVYMCMLTSPSLTSVLPLLWVLLHATGGPLVLCFRYASDMGRMRPQMRGYNAVGPKPAAEPIRAEKKAILRTGSSQIACPGKACSKRCCFSSICICPECISMRMRPKFWRCFCTTNPEGRDFVSARGGIFSSKQWDFLLLLIQTCHLLFVGRETWWPVKPVQTLTRLDAVHLENTLQQPAGEPGHHRFICSPPSQKNHPATWCFGRAHVRKQQCQSLDSRRKQT